MAIDWQEESGTVVVSQVINLGASIFGYAAIAGAGYLFKLAIAASLPFWIASLCATVIGAFVTYVPARAIMLALESLGLGSRFLDSIIFVLQFGLSPMVGAYVLNWALGSSLPLMPLLTVGGVGVAIFLLVLFTIQGFECCQDNSSKLPNSDGHGYRSNSMFNKNPNQNGSKSKTVPEPEVETLAIAM